MQKIDLSDLPDFNLLRAGIRKKHTSTRRTISILYHIIFFKLTQPHWYPSCVMWIPSKGKVWWWESKEKEAMNLKPRPKSCGRVADWLRRSSAQRIKRMKSPSNRSHLIRKQLSSFLQLKMRSPFQLCRGRVVDCDAALSTESRPKDRKPTCVEGGGRML